MFCNKTTQINKEISKKVTILVLLDYVLQYQDVLSNQVGNFGHNPCFIRLCFAIVIIMITHEFKTRHNPCFIRLCFAMRQKVWTFRKVWIVTILVLLDYVLQ